MSVCLTSGQNLNYIQPAILSEGRVIVDNSLHRNAGIPDLSQVVSVINFHLEPGKHRNFLVQSGRILSAPGQLRL